MITKNFRLNALANKYASALYNHITSTSGGDYFMIDADGEAVRVEIVNGVKGVAA
ncbi:putative prophage protein [Escherichia coli]|nr:putative prophage protein [Escherichia coli]